MIVCAVATIEPRHLVPVLSDRASCSSTQHPPFPIEVAEFSDGERHTKQEARL